MKRKRQGFTLVEMLVAIATASIIAAAGAVLVLLCLRFQNAVAAESQRQNSARAALTLVEQMAEAGTLNEPEIPKGDRPIVLTSGEAEEIVLYYDPADSALYAGGDAATGTRLMDGMRLTLNLEGRLLTVGLLNEAGEYYETTVFGRTWNTPEIAGLPSLSELIKETSLKEGTGRYKLLSAAYEQLGSHGEIKGAAETWTYFSEWYCGGYGSAKPGWSYTTPWCACFASWCIDQINKDEDGGFFAAGAGAATLRQAQVSEWLGALKAKAGAYLPAGASGTLEQVLPGDLIFFDWDREEAPGQLDTAPLNKDDADHIGFVLQIKDGYVYTIEGNSGGRVRRCRYAITDPCILGYGLLPWKEAEAPAGT